MTGIAGPSGMVAAISVGSIICIAACIYNRLVRCIIRLDRRYNGIGLTFDQGYRSILERDAFNRGYFAGKISGF